MAHNHGSDDGHSHAAPNSFGRVFAVGIEHSTWQIEYGSESELLYTTGNPKNLIAAAAVWRSSSGYLYE